MKISLKETGIHAHLRGRMQQRGISIEEIETTINSGWDAKDAKEGTVGKVYVFAYNASWEGRHFDEKEVSVYYKPKGREIILLTAKARYGRHFPKGGDQA